MKYSGLYFIPTPSAQPTDSSTTASALISSLETHFRTLTRSTPWTLTFRLFRDTPLRSDPTTTTTTTTTDSPTVPHAHTYQHFLTHSALGNRCYVHVATPPGSTAKTPASVVAIPLNQADAQAALLRNQLAALWSPRQTLGVQNGATYQGGLFAVQIGEVRALREAQGAGVSSPGVVVCISTVMGGGEDADEDNEDKDGKAKNGAENGAGQEVDVGYAQAMIRDLWGNIRQGRDLGRAEVREVFMVLNNGRPDVDAAVRMWCEVLRLRG